MARLLSRAALLAGITIFAWSVCAQEEARKPLVENEHVRITRVEVANKATLSGKTPYDTVALQLQDGETQLLETAQLPKPLHSKSGDFQYFVAGSKRSIRNMSKQPVSFIVIQFLRPPGKYEPMDVNRTHYCNPGTQACVTEHYSFCTDRFCAESVTLDPSAISTQHTHSADHILIATSNFTWKEEAVGKAPEDHTFTTGEVHYIPAGITHRFINVGTTTAKMFVIQYK